MTGTQTRGMALVGLEQMVRRQRILADFGEFALGSDDLDAVLTQACVLVGRALGTDLAKVIEIEDAGRTLFVRAGVGWPPGVVGVARLPMDERSSETHSIAAGEPVVVPDIAAETRFMFPAFLREAGAVGMVNVPIFLPGRRAYGLLQVDSRAPWHPDDDDIQFLRTYATVLGPVIDRLHTLHALRDAERRNETLLHELQHRIKNNIGVITALVRLRLRRALSPEARDELGVVRDRIETLRLVHEQVYAAGAGDRLGLRAYVERLLRGLLALHAEAGATLDAAVDDVALDADTMIPLGLILNEFVTNSLKYAFSAPGGRIAVTARREGGVLRVRIADDGAGLPARREPAAGGGTGMTLIDRLCRQIGAAPRWPAHRGTALEFDVPLRAEVGTTGA